MTGDPLGRTPAPLPGAEPMRAGVSIVAALVNAVGEETGKETVTLLNRTDVDIAIEDWEMADRTDRRQRLSETIAAGETRRIQLAPDHGAPRLRNKGGGIRLLTPDGPVADVVAYEKHQAAREGWTTLF